MIRITTKLTAACLAVILAMACLALGFATLARSEPSDVSLPLSIEDQNNLREVCKAAMQNMGLATPLVYSISAWCLTKDQQVKQLADKLKEEPK